MDAIHLSTARRLDAKEFFTYEPRLVKFGELTGLAVSSPYTTQPLLPETRKDFNRQ